MPSVLFIHRSVGRNLIADGEIYGLVRGSGSSFSFNDFDQNNGILQNESGGRKVNWQFPGNDTTPADYADLFSVKMQSSNNATLAAILKNNVIVIKSCYPNSNITDLQTLEAAQRSYQSVTSFFKMMPDKKLVIMTTPPLIPLRTNMANAARARQLANWLAENNFAKNIFVFDFFNELAGRPNEHQPNMLRREFRRFLPFDSHPNVQASRIIAPKFVDFLFEVVSG